MPKVKVDGMVKHFPYTKSGKANAKKMAKKMKKMTSDGYMKA